MILSFIKDSGIWAFSQVTISSLLFYGFALTLIFAVSFVLLVFSRQGKSVKVTKPSRKFPKDGPEVIIIGSGVAGSAMAAVLARDGRKVTVIERDMKEPDRIVGELLQPGGVLALNKLGLNDCINNLDAHQIKGYIIHNLADKSEVAIPYSSVKGQVDQASDITAGSAFHHGRFIMALREKAKNEQNITYIEGTASKLLEENGVVIGVQYREKGEDVAKEIHAPLTFVVDGCFSKFRKELVMEPVQVTSHFVGFLMNHCPQTVNNYAELVLVEPSPVLIYQISSNSTRVLVDIPGILPKKVKEYLLDSILPQLPEHIQEPFRDGVENSRVRSMPNSFLPPSSVERPGVVVLGDAYNMRHPLTGGGMSVCLNDAVIWRELLTDIEDFTDYETIIKALRLFHLRRKRNHAFVVNIMAQALYKLFSANDNHLSCLKNTCFDYFKLGGKCISGPVSLLSVLNPKPHILIGHFFAVVLYCVFNIFRSEPIWAVHRTICRSAMILFSACRIIFPLIWTETKYLFYTY